MGKDTKIEWCHHTFNPWIGCTEVSPACDLCYARTMAHRYGWAEWGNHPRHRTSKQYWRQPLKWNAEARAAGERHRVFCASLADVFDNQVPDDWRADLGRMIDATPDLDWLLLTKRPQNARRMLDHMFSHLGGWPSSGARNVWLGTTVENQDEADRRIRVLAEIPAVVRFLSMEPLIGPVHIDRQYMARVGHRLEKPAISWVIAGGESGNAIQVPGESGEMEIIEPRPMHPQWVRHIKDQCEDADVPFFFKQWGEYVETSDPDDHELVGIDPEVAEHDCAFNTGEAAWMKRVGKKNSGRLLDGREYNEVPLPMAA